MATGDVVKPNISNDTWEDSVSYSQFLLGTVQFVSNNFERTRLNYTFPTNTKQDLIKCLANLTAADAAIIFILAIVWTLLRHLATKYIFKPIGRRCQLPVSERETKLPESAWKFCFYLGSWTAVAYILLTGEAKYLHRPSSIWEDYSMDMVVPTSIYAVYVVEISFYVHSIYATAFVDQWRRDSIVLIAHHIITITLLVFTLSIKCHRLGIIAIFLHDICDVLLEGTKTSLYFKKQGKRTVPIFERLADIGFACFAVTWFVARLYWFPLRHIYVTSVVLDEKQLNVPFMLFLNTLLYALLAMNIYWFSFILNLLYKVITGQVLEDNRDYEEDEAEEESEASKSQGKKQTKSDIAEKQNQKSIESSNSSNRREKSESILRQRKSEQQSVSSAEVSDGRSN